MKPKIIVILGPTAVGKSDTAVQLALDLKKKGITSQIISADSRQVYTGLNIGAGKITKKEMKGVKHFGLDIVSPTRKKMFSVSEFKEYAEGLISEMTKSGIVPIICGGTGFYIDALIDGVVLPEVPPNPELRKKLEKKTAESLYALLQKIDSSRAKKVDPHNKVRLIRSIEIAKALGKVPRIETKQLYNSLVIGLDIEKEILREKVHTRALKRLKAGMVREAKRLKQKGVSWKRMEQFGLEYGLLARLITGKLSREEFIDRLLIETWKYAKRQKTWFYRRKETHWFDPTKKSTAKAILKLSATFLRG